MHTRTLAYATANPHSGLRHCTVHTPPPPSPTSVSPIHVHLRRVPMTFPPSMLPHARAFIIPRDDDIYMRILSSDPVVHSALFEDIINSLAKREIGLRLCAVDKVSQGRPARTTFQPATPRRHGRRGIERGLGGVGGSGGVAGGGGGCCRSRGRRRSRGLVGSTGCQGVAHHVTDCRTDCNASRRRCHLRHQSGTLRFCRRRCRWRRRRRRWVRCRRRRRGVVRMMRGGRWRRVVVVMHLLHRG